MLVKKDGTLAEGVAWEDVGLVGRIWYHDGELQTINGKIEIVETAGKYFVVNKDAIINKSGDVAGDKITNVIQGDNNITNAIDGRIDAKLGDVSGEVEKLKPRVERNEKDISIRHEAQPTSIHGNTHKYYKHLFLFIKTKQAFLSFKIFF